MADELVTGLRQGTVRVLAVVVTQLARRARDLHHLGPASAVMLGQALAAVALQAGLLKEGARLSLQLECDGPLRGLFVDHDGEGGLRGYVKARSLELQGQPGGHRFRPLLGNSGFLSALRQSPDGEFYRSSVALESFDLALDLERFFRTSDQVPTRVWLETVERDGDPLGEVVGFLAQLMPGTEASQLDEVAAAVSTAGGVAGAIRRDSALSASRLLGLLSGTPAPEVMGKTPLAYRCRCSRERVQKALSSLGAKELEALVADPGYAEATCEFCASKYHFDADQLRALAAGLDSPG